MTGEQVRDRLRAVNPQLEQRSLRRGRIQALAVGRNRMSDEELLKLSRHTTVEMLRRYLNMGLLSANNEVDARRITLAENQC